MHIIQMILQVKRTTCCLDCAATAAAAAAIATDDDVLHVSFLYRMKC